MLDSPATDIEQDTNQPVFLTERAERIRDLGKRAINDVIEIGQLLTECKDRLGHGNWLPWLDREFGWTDETARRFMNVHELGKSHNLWNLTVPVSDLYLVAAPSTPESARSEVIKRAEAGERLKHDEVRAIIAAHSPKAVLKAAATLRAATYQAGYDARKQTLYSPTEVTPGLHVGDFRELSPQIIHADSVELVFTDPVYDEDSVPIYGDAAKEAARILKPGGSMLCYFGHAHLLKVCAQLAEHLDYFWLADNPYDGGPQELMHFKGIDVGHKPLLWFVKGYRGDTQRLIRDTVLTNSEEKDFHPWQQPLAVAEHFVRKLTSERGIVVDFFTGSGTTAVAAKTLGRQCICFEIDPATAERASQRIAAAPLPMPARANGSASGET